MLHSIRSVYWIGIAALLLLPAAHSAGLNDTGITTCANETESGLPCPVDGFPGQDAEFGRDAEAAAGTLTKIGGGAAGFDFTKLDANGNELPASATNHYCVRDNVTGLIWEVKTDDGGLRDKDWTYTWYDTNSPDGNKGTVSGGACYKSGRCDTEKFVQDVNSAGLCGFSDWRMPMPKEMREVADLSGLIYTDYFLNCLLFSWSGSPLFSYSDYAWANVVTMPIYRLRSMATSVQLVRGKQSVDSFIDNDNGTVSQTNTGLMWAKCTEGQIGTNCTGSPSVMNWSAALTAANNSRLGGYSDWRLPNVKELQALVDHNRVAPAIDTAYFPNTPSLLDSAWFLSSSVTTSIGLVNFYYDTFSAGNRDYGGHVRLVRTAEQHLTVNKSGDGNGTIKSSDAVIDCGSKCGGDFNDGTKIILTATADANSTFAGWSGACTNKTGTCSVTMNKAQTVTATFNAKPINYSLAISKIGTGTVKSSDGKINCGIGSGCIADFEKGSNVILTAIPDSGSTFVSWTGCTAETTNALQCQFKITANKTVTANFATIPSGYTLTVKTTGNGIVISNPVGINCGADCAENFTSTEVVMLTAKPSDGENLLNWNGCVANATNPMQCRVTLNKNVNVTAAFSNKTTPNADIQITDVVLIPVAPSSGKSFKAQITLKNIGNVVLENGGNLEVWVNEPAGQSCGASGDGFADIDKLVRNESKTVTVDLVAPEKGIQRLRVFADSRCQVKELSEQNNQSVTRYTVK